MAKTGDSSKSKPKPRAARPARPSFTPPATPPAAGSAWVYRSDAPAAAPARPAPPISAAPAAKAPPRRAAKAAVPPAAAIPSPRASRVTHAMDVVTLPIAVSLMAVLAPVRWLLGPSRH